MLFVKKDKPRDHSLVSVSLSCRRDFSVSAKSRDCLRCRRSPVIRRAVLDRASVKVLCRASASGINAARLDRSLSMDARPLSLALMLGT
jgi:hypothetical protein